MDEEACDLADREHEDGVEEALERCALVHGAVCGLAWESGIARRSAVGCARWFRLVRRCRQPGQSATTCKAVRGLKRPPRGPGGSGVGERSGGLASISPEWMAATKAAAAS